MTDVTKHELEKDTFERLVLAAPTADITNLNSEADMKELKEKVRHSCLNIMNIAENAIEEHKTLKNITILEHTPRFDSIKTDPKGVKHNLVMFANSYMRELWIDSPHNKSIHVGSHSMNAPAIIRNAWHTDEYSGKYDGVHYFSKSGKDAYTRSIINILQTSFQTMPGRQYMPMSEENHTTCPQAMYMNRKKRLYSDIVAGTRPVKTSNRFTPLNQISGNW